jgi:hypothetical protein
MATTNENAHPFWPGRLCFVQQIQAVFGASQLPGVNLSWKAEKYALILINPPLYYKKPDLGEMLH